MYRRDAEAVPHIVHVIHRLSIGGLENGVVNLVNRMPPECYRNSIVCLAGYDEAFRARIYRDNVRVITLGKRPGKDIAAYGRMYRELRRLRPAIVHTRNLGTIDMQWVAAAAGVPHRVHGEHGWEAGDPRGQDPKGLRIRRACRPVIHRYVPMSCDLAQWLERDVHVDPSRIRQLYSGVDVERFRPSPTGQSAEATAGLGAATVRSLMIGTVGRLDPVKNQSALLDVFATLLHGFPGLRLTLVGGGPLRSPLEAQAARLGISGQVAFTGDRSDTAELMRGFNIFVLPSLNEGISNTILEAMATGLPVVAARVGGNPELVADGVTGRLYDPQAPGALEAALESYLADPGLRDAHGRAGRDRVVQNFSLDSMVSRYLALYDELLSSR